jgi:hypothetical protein
VLNECESSENQLNEAFGNNDSGESGEQVSNTWATYPSGGNNSGKLLLMPDGLGGSHDLPSKAPALRDRPAVD